MNPSEVACIQETWKLVSPDLGGAGSIILHKFFVKYPDNLAHFDWFKGTPLPDLPNLPRFKSHVKKIMDVFDRSVNVLSQPDGAAQLEAIWGDMAKTHVNRKISMDSYNQLKGIILEVLSEHCKLNDEQKAAWTKCMDTIMNILFTKLKAAGAL